MILLFAGIITANAQGPRRSVDDRVQIVMEKMAALKLDKDQTEKTTAIFTETLKAQEKKMGEMRSGGGMDREAMMAYRTKATEERNEKLKKVITENPDKTYLISKLGAGLANRYMIFETIIGPNIKKELLHFKNVRFLW